MNYWNRLERCFIVAEIGVNHNGDIALAKRMIEAAHACGADAVKFQTYITEENTSRLAQKAAYQKAGAAASESLYDMIKRFELSLEDHVELKRFCEETGICFFSRASGPGALQMLMTVGVPFLKVGSLDITYHQLLDGIAATGLPILLSTGASRMAEVAEALGVIRSRGNENVLLYHCTSNYPAAMSDVNLRAMLALRDEFDLPVGYSDHTEGYEVACAAVALGAVSLEKHFTLDRTLPGPDHKASLEPEAFASMVSAVRNVEAALGDGVKQPRPNEAEMILQMRRSIVALRDLPKGTVLSPEVLGVKRPGTGLAPKHRDAILGCTLKRDVARDEPITSNCLTVDPVKKDSTP